MTTSNIESITVTAVGIGGTILGCLDLTNGRIRKGILALFSGMTFTNLGGRFLGLNSNSHSKLMQGALGAGTCAVGLQGAFRLASGVRQKSVAEIIKGSIKTAMGIAGTVYVYSLDSRIILIAHQASVIALPSSFIAKLGFQDLVNGHYRQGAGKILLGIGGIASAGYYVYSSCINQDTLSADQRAFLKVHIAEIEQMYQYPTPTGNWRNLGHGVSKTAFVHPDFPGMLIKIPNGKIGFRGATGEGDLILHHTNLERIRPIAATFDRIVLPESHLYSTPNGLIIVEQKFELISYYSVPESQDREEVMRQFYAFERAADLCDLDPRHKHNAGILNRTTPPKIGIIDFDCRNYQMNSQAWDWDFRNPNSHFLVPENRNQISALFLATGTAILGGAAAVAKKISEINPRRVLLLGFGVGAVTTGFLAFHDDGGLDQPAATIVGTGVAMAATAIVTIAAAKLCTLGKRLFSICCRYIQRPSPIEMETKA